ncbi:copper resistance protein CopC [Burkholderia sp. Bp9002]|nr:copper resistance protein CopC [Burkholderia sp. Bp9125]RQS13940.1 copper resistance protein CopC [Burkholderia sp. Bp9002]
MKTSTLTHLVALATGALLALAPLVASAHGKLERASPASGSTVEAAPDTLRLTFNEDLEAAFSTIVVADANGTAVTQDKARVDASAPRVMTVAVPKLAAGTYTVRWAVMTADAHKTRGTYTFTVK